MLDDDWFDQFYETALPVVYGYFFRRCGGRNDVAEDLTQETFMSVVRSLNTGAEVTAPLPWVVAIARRRLVDYYRKERRRRDSWRSVVANEPAPATTTPAQTTTTLAEALLMTALDRVPATQRAALVLRYVDDLPVREVAGLIGRSERATESLLSRGRRSLRRAYEEVDDD